MKMNIILKSLILKTHIPPKILCYIDSEVFNIRDFKIIFILGYPLTPAKAPFGGGRGRGPRGGFSPILPMNMKIIFEFTTIENQKQYNK